MITIRDYFERRKQGETVKGIAASIGKSTKALNRSLERAGYKADGNNQWYYTGDGQEPLDQLLRFGRQNNQKKYNSHDTSANASKGIGKKKSQNNSRKEHNQDSKDMIDFLLTEQKRSQNQNYMGFYTTDEVKSVLDSVPTGNKSKLITEILEKAFKEKGLL